jgi:hypothetical protein
VIRILVGKMTKKKEQPTDIVIHKKINERVTNQRMQEIVKRVIELMGDNHTTMDICRILQPELGKSESQVKVYVRRATELLQKHAEGEATHKRMEMEISLRKDLKTAYYHFNILPDDNRNKLVWYKLILETKDRLSKFLPQEENKDDNQTINITYNAAPKKPRDV